MTAANSRERGNTLIAAVLAHDGHRARQALDRGENPNARDTNTGLTALMLGAGHGRPDLVAALLQAGADVYALDRAAGATALHKACQGGSLECVRLLVDAGAFVDAQCVTTGHTALVEAIWFKQTDIVRYLLDRGAGLAIDTHYGFTLDRHIAYAETVNHSVPAELAKVRAAKSAVQERRDNDARMAQAQLLMAATVRGDVQAARDLLKSGAKPDERFPVVNGFNDAHTPLLVASRDGRIEIVIELLAAGADVNATEPTFGAVPLHKAVYNGHDAITQVLIRAQGVNLDFQGATNGYTPLLDALWHGFDKCALPLIEAGARLDVAGHDGKTPLVLAEAVFGVENPVTDALRKRL
jgi:ankyrin repeat protein